MTARDEVDQAFYIVERVLENREEGMNLKQQAVLFRASHHSTSVELELTRRNIPFVKFGGLKFLDTAHVKDLLAVLRFVENPRDRVAGFRVLQLLPGVGRECPENGGMTTQRMITVIANRLRARWLNVQRDFRQRQGHAMAHQPVGAGGDLQHHLFSGVPLHGLILAAGVGGHSEPSGHVLATGSPHHVAAVASCSSARCVAIHIWASSSV